jgi:5'-nucleotidase
MAVTPLKVDLTDHESLAYWAQTATSLRSNDLEVPG